MPMSNTDARKRHAKKTEAADLTPETLAEYEHSAAAGRSFGASAVRQILRALAESRALVDRCWMERAHADVQVRAHRRFRQQADYALRDLETAALARNAAEAERDAARHAQYLAEQDRDDHAAREEQAEAERNKWREKAALHEHGYCEHSIEHNERLSRRLADTEEALSRALADLATKHQEEGDRG